MDAGKFLFLFHFTIDVNIENLLFKIWF